MTAATHEPGLYRQLHADAILRLLEGEGWNPVPIADAPETVYEPHRHAATKLFAFLAGTMEVRAGGETFRCAAGDKLVIPGSVEHTATVGPEGCRYLWCEQLRGDR